MTPFDEVFLGVGLCRGAYIAIFLKFCYSLHIRGIS